ncbi:uncharacterized protein LOC112597226 [Melanaphis sacchari]|uniref:uncharacterized protein LOC112597226 n=1 Tax=Melanaphis sacchari TaxID=742174 RepID=UPI000DC14FD9|nr:uncharacterized protein LOC112597226 [Melanaphis sacchari]
MVVLPVFGLLVTVAVQRIYGQCEFPAQWSGRWFQSGVNHYININTTTIMTKGECVQNVSDKFLIEDRDEDCRRCLVITEKHQNVIQYKENAICEKRSLDELCGEITSDAPLYSMFRVDATPIPCPFDGLQAPFHFSYSRGGYTECKSPVSKADSCTSDSRLMLKFQACPDVLNTESTVEELLCLATWKDGSTKYMIGKLEHTPTSSDEEKYRCFVVGKSMGGTFDMAQSGDATCNGMSSPTDGSRTMKFVRAENHHHHGVGSGCRYPLWLTEHHTWHSLNHGHTYHFSPRNGTLRKSIPGAGSDHDIRATCYKVINVTDNKALIITHYTIGCQSGYACMGFYRRDSQVVEVQESENPMENADDACRPDNFHSQQLTYSTLVPPSPQGRECPFLGRYEISGGLNAEDVGKALAASRPGSENNQDKPSIPCNPPGKQYLTIGCNSLDTMEFQSECGTKTVAAYTCYGHWKNEITGINYVISTPQGRSATNSRRYCFIMSQVNGMAQQTLHIASVMESCHPHPLGRLHWAFNITHQGLCSSESNSAIITGIPVLVLIAALLATIVNCR